MLMFGQLEERPSNRLHSLVFPEQCGQPQAVGDKGSDQVLAKCDQQGSCNGKYTPSSQGMLVRCNNSSPWVN